MMARILFPHAIGTVAEHIAQTDRIVFCVLPGKPGAEAPHKSPGTALGGKGFVINQERAGKLQIAVKFAADRALPAYHAGGPKSHRVTVPADIIFRRVPVGAGEGKAPVKGQSCVFMGFLENMDIVVIDESPGIDTVHQIFRLDFHIICLCLADSLWKERDYHKRE